MKKTITMMFALCCFIFMSSDVQAQNFNTLQGIFDNVAGNKRPPDGGGEGGGTGTGGSGSGGGEQIVGIHLNWPATGKMVNQASELSWKSGEAGAHTITIKEKTTAAVDPIFVASTTGNNFYIPLNHLDLSANKSYEVQVKAGTAKSSKSVFSVVDKSVYHNAIKAAKADPKFTSGSKLMKILMKSYALEDAKLLKAAAGYFKKYMANEKDNIALRNMRDEFKTRTNYSSF